jgi:hypothetical protein
MSLTTTARLESAVKTQPGEISAPQAEHNVSIGYLRAVRHCARRTSCSVGLCDILAASGAILHCVTAMVAGIPSCRCAEMELVVYSTPPEPERPDLVDAYSGPGPAPASSTEHASSLS